MERIEFTRHALDMLSERNIPEGWVWRTIDSPDRTQVGPDSNAHYIKPIAEIEGRFLRVVLNPHVSPKRVVTVFVDRRLRRPS